ncbi:transcription elongation factor GreA [bacterium 210917-DFI.7.65]|nr:transcription elongation factor GreA [bacterium 210917-DFI.7.65]MCB7513125.1 transcription elongation factor GreA [bacterium 210917-SL.2.15]
MYDELTQVDIDKMNEEITYRKTVLRPKLIEDVQTARGFGDLSENFEYKCAKRDKNRNDSRIRYLERMVATAKVIDNSGADDGAVALFSKVTLLNEKLQKEQTIRIVTTLRQNALKGLISKESPVGRALLGHRAGDRVEISVNPEMKYTVVIRSVEPGEDDASLDISAY